MSLAPVVADYLVEVATQDRAFAYFHITPDGCLLDWGGELSRYRLRDLQQGDTIETHLFFLAGLLPMSTASEVLPGIHVEVGLIADIHLISRAQGNWVLLFDTTATTEQQQRLQQKGNDLSLLRHQYNKLLNQCLTSQQSVTPHTEAPALPITSNQKDISVLLVKICDLTQYSQQSTPAETLSTLNAYISRITQIIIEESGVINHILGETAVALFGLLPGHQSAPKQAVHAARRVTKYFQNIESLHLSEVDAIFRIASGITTGQATAGVVRNQGQSSLNAIGTHVHYATQLNALLEPGNLLIDRPTFQALAELQVEFESITSPSKVNLPQLYRSLSAKNYSDREQPSQTDTVGDRRIGERKN
ncbi:MAG: adenylate/guanylate cyclase domain-containing protein [Cyanobacteria bacterium J06641_5]